MARNAQAPDPVDGRAARPAGQVAAPAAKAAKDTPETAAKKASQAERSKPADPSLHGMGSSRAAAAYLYYRNMGPARSLPKMARQYDTQRGTPETRQKSYERWSSKYGWVAKAQEWDQEQADKDAERKRKQRDRMDEDQAGAMSQLWFTSLDRVNELVQLDRIDQQAYSNALAAWLAQDPKDRGEFPRQPKTRVGAIALTQLMRTGLEYERISRQAATEILAVSTGSDPGLPPVLEVHTTNERPADPVDPFEDSEESHAGPPAEARKAAAAALPAAIARLQTRPPKLSDDEPWNRADDEDGEDDEAGDDDEDW